jgi:hypothetical protein
MQIDIWPTIIAAAGGAALAYISYVFKRDREAEASLRTEKIALYKELVSIMSKDYLGSGDMDFAPQNVLKALQMLEDEMGTGSGVVGERQTNLLSGLFSEVRKDLGIWPKDEPDFRIKLSTVEYSERDNAMP